MESVEREDNQVFIGMVLGFVVWAAAKGICFVLISWLVTQLIVVLLQFDLPCGSAGSNFLGL